MQNNNNYVTPKAFFGALVPLVSSLISVGVNRNNNKMQGEREERTRKLTNLEKERNALIQSADVVEGIDNQGEEVDSLYREKGGLVPHNLAVENNDAQSLSSDTVKLGGDDHSDGGTMLYKDGKPVVEAEKDETLQVTDNEARIFSDTLLVPNTKRTFAKASELLATRKGKLEKELKPDSTLIKKNTINRKLENLSKEEDKLFNLQESIKPKNEIGEAKYGDSFYFDKFYDKEKPKDLMFKEKEANKDLPGPRVGKEPYNMQIIDPIDKAQTVVSKNNTGNNQTHLEETNNAGNYAAPPKTGEGLSTGDIAQGVNLIANTLNTLTKPKVAKPILNRTPSFNTEVRVGDKLAKVKNAVEQSKDFIKNNTSNSNVARGNVIATKLAGVQQENAILADKENKETALKNRATEIQTGVGAGNTALLNATNQEKVNRKLAQRSELSDITKNATEYVQNKEFVKRQEDLDLKKIDIYSDIYDNNGTSFRFSVNQMNTGHELRNAMIVAKSSGRSGDIKAVEEKAKELGIVLN